MEASGHAAEGSPYWGRCAELACGVSGWSHQLGITRAGPIARVQHPPVAEARERHMTALKTHFCCTNTSCELGSFPSGSCTLWQMGAGLSLLVWPPVSSADLSSEHDSLSSCFWSDHWGSVQQSSFQHSPEYCLVDVLWGKSNFPVKEASWWFGNRRMAEPINLSCPPWGVFDINNLARSSHVTFMPECYWDVLREWTVSHLHRRECDWVSFLFGRKTHCLRKRMW